jgi:CRISPR-associated protein Csb1
MTEAVALTHEMIDAWADDLRGPVALTLKQKLTPVEGEGGVIFPPTYASEKHPYCIDELADGTKTALIDSVGSQANRMEPLFIKAADGRGPNPAAKLVPQVDILVPDRRPDRVSIMSAGHRLGDAIVRASDLADDAKAAFKAFLDRGDAALIAKLAPTSLVFGVWDSRDTHAKLPRIVQSVVRAWNVSVLKRSATYVQAVDYVALEAFSELKKKPTTNDRSGKGYANALSTDDPGGIIAHGGVTRDVTVNLTALRRLDGENGQALRHYILGLALVAAAEPLDGCLRQGCLLTPDPAAPADWVLVNRDGTRRKAALTADTALAYAERAASAFGVGEDRTARFDKKKVKNDMEKEDPKAKD